jgi:hypothetical protein
MSGRLPVQRLWARGPSCSASIRAELDLVDLQLGAAAIGGSYGRRHAQPE